MGTAMSKKKPSGNGVMPDLSPPEGWTDAGTQVRRKRTSTIYDSGELAILPKKAGTGQLPENTKSFKKGGNAGLGKAVDVLDVLGSSVVSLNHKRGFITGVHARGDKISILSFEVANTISRASALWRSFSDENIKLLREKILQSDGIKTLVSSDKQELLWLTVVDKREELAMFSKEVIRFGDLCKDPAWHNLGRYIQRLEMDPNHDSTKEDAEATMEQLMILAENTSELYHEMHALDSFEKDYHTKFQGEDSPASIKRESMAILHSELKRQRKLVKSLKKKSLWSRHLEEIVEKFVDIVIYLHRRIRDSFPDAGTGYIGLEQVQNKRLGACGLSLHYANIINQIDNIVCQPFSLPPNARDNLYRSLPATLKSTLRSRLQSSGSNAEYTISQIKAEMQKTLSWILPMAESTLKLHQGFGWVGEWANNGGEMSGTSSQLDSITRVQTLFYADKQKTEQHILELVIWLHHLIKQVRDRGQGNKSSASRHNPISLNKGTSSSPAVKDVMTARKDLSIDDRDLLDLISLRKITYKRSKSWEPRRGEITREIPISHSCGNSPVANLVTLASSNQGMIHGLLDGVDTQLSSSYSPLIF